MKRLALIALITTASTAYAGSDYLDTIGMTALVSDLITPHYTSTDLDCLTDNVYFEARGETKTGQRAVVEVSTRRLEDGRWGSTYCDVVHYPYAFSWTLEDSVVDDRVLWNSIRNDVIWYLNNPLEWNANHYHADYITPYWAAEMSYVAHIGGHIFYTDRG